MLYDIFVFLVVAYVLNYFKLLWVTFLIVLTVALVYVTAVSKAHAEVGHVLLLIR